MIFRPLLLFVSLLLMNGCPFHNQNRSQTQPRPSLGQMQHHVSQQHYEAHEGYRHQEDEREIIRETRVHKALPLAGQFIKDYMGGPTTVCNAGEERSEISLTEEERLIAADAAHNGDVTSTGTGPGAGDGAPVTAIVLNDEGEHMKKVLVCILDKVFPPPPPAIARMRTVNFISDRVAKNFKEYGISDNTEKAHMLSNIIHESAGFTTTVENLPRSERWKATRRGQSQVWDKDLYARAVAGDTNYFNNTYVHSKDNYKAKFRGRGLVQMTGCSNYLSFLLSFSAKQAGREELAERSIEHFQYRDDRGRIRKVEGMYCDDKTWGKAIDHIKEKYGIDIVPPELKNDFERSVNHLSIPAPGVEIPPMSSKDFVVDSAFHYWKRCRREYPESVLQTSDDSLANAIACVHGAPGEYRKKENQRCPFTGSNWIHQSFCSRKKMFHASRECLAQIKYEEKE